MQYIEIDQAKRFGKPYIKGPRITVTDSLEMLTSGVTQTDILEELPNLLPEQITAALLYVGKQLPGVGRPLKADWIFYNTL